MTKRYVLFAAIALAIVGGAVAVWVRARPPALLQVAQPLPDLGDVPVWLTTRNVLRMNVGRDDTEPLFSNLGLIDTASGASLPLPGLESALKAIDAAAFGAAPTPDGRAILVTGGVHVHGQEARLLDLQGRTLETWSAPDTIAPTWAPDGRTWYSLGNGGGDDNHAPPDRIITWSRDHPGKPVARARVDLFPPDGETEYEGPVISNGWAVMLAPTTTDVAPGPHFQRMAFPVTGSRPVVSRTSFALPADAEVGEFALSPDGTRAAWVLQRGGVTPFRRLLHRVLSFIPATGSWDVGLWVSASDGRGMKLLGVLAPSRRPMDISAGGGDLDTAEVAPSGITWAPDGRTLAFEYRHQYYRVQAPP